MIGGAVSCTGLSCSFSGCHFEGNTATQDGAAIYVGGSKDIEISDCTFINNTAQGNGGADPKLINSVIINFSYRSHCI